MANKYAYFKTSKDISGVFKEPVVKIKENGDGTSWYQVLIDERPLASFWDYFHFRKARLSSLGWSNFSDLPPDLTDGGEPKHKFAAIDGGSVGTDEEE
jgi:hypothetical protein